jgi:hypothetical protein
MPNRATTKLLRSLFKLAIAAVLLFSSGMPVNAEEMDIGHLETANDTGINWLNFHCNRNGGSLSCDVFQTLIAHKVEPDQREKEISKKLSGNVVEEFKKAFGTTCDNLGKIQPLVNKSVETGIGQDGRKLNPNQAREAKIFLDSMAAACEHTNITAIRRFVEIGVDKDIHTCRVINSHSHMDFSLDPAAQVWISREGPTPSCGTVSVGTLEKDKGSAFWLYTEKVVRANPSGSLPNGLSCSNFHDRTMHYTWRAADNFVECTHIENGMN